MRRFFVLIFVFLLWGCRDEMDGGLVTAVPPTIPPADSPISSATSQIFLPLTNTSATATPTEARPSSTPAPTATPDYPLYTGAPIQRSDFGIQVHIQQEDLRPIIDRLRDLGVGWVKVQVSWKLFQPYADQYSADRFAELDELVRRASDSGIAVLLSVSKAPEWSRPTTELDGPPADFGLYRDFMAYLAGRYQGRVAAYELWNEPNLQREWSGGAVRNGRTLNAADFVNLIREGGYGRAHPQRPSQLLLQRHIDGLH
ncbi:MAG: cellulase family glycosylhydrolase [Anaerolineae bacterium]